MIGYDLNEDAAKQCDARPPINDVSKSACGAAARSLSALTECGFRVIRANAKMFLRLEALQFATDRVLYDRPNFAFSTNLPIRHLSPKSCVPA